MSPKVGTVMGKLSLVAGVRQERVTNVAAVKPARAIFRKRKKERLYVVVEVTGDPPGRDEIYSELVRIASEEYFKARGSITAKLRQAIRAANAFLLQENLNALPPEQRVGSITCAVLREGDVYIAQAGPTAAYVSCRGELTCFPESELTADEAVPLGLKRGVPVRFYHHKVKLGDAILLASSSLAQQASPEQIAQAVVGQDVGRALADLEELAGEGDASAMLVRVVPVEAKPRVKRRAVRRPARGKVEAAAKERLPRPDRSGLGRRVKAAAKERLPRPDWSSLKRGVSSVLRGTGDFLTRLLPEEEAPAPSQRVTRPRQPSRPAKGRRKLWRGLAIAIPVIVVILVIVVYWQQEVARQARFEELVTQAEQRIALAGGVDEGGRPRYNEATARDHLLAALDSLAEAEALVPDKPEVSNLQQEIVNRLKAIDKVIELHWIAPLWEYGEPGSDPSRVIVSGIDVYVLDKGLDRVYKHLLDDTMQALQELQDSEANPVLLRKGDQRGAIVVGELVDMVWAEAEAGFASEGGRQESSLLVLEGGGSLLEYDPEKGISVLPVGESDGWSQPQIAGSHKGSFYLLDLGLNQILRYRPDYSGSAEDYFPAPGEVDLAGAVDMAVVGPVYVLYADGRIMKFDDGQLATFEITGLYEPLQNPTALFASQEAEFLYVADAGHNRIVQLTKEGRFVRQFKAKEGEALNQLKGLFALEEYNLLYFVSGSKLYVTNIPLE